MRSFSYADIAKQFALVMGVTGTLQSLNDVQKEMIREQYNIHRLTFNPSV